MIDSENEENIDQTQWLPKDAPIVNPWRARKFDLETYRVDGEIRTAQAHVNSLLNFLEAGKVLDSQHVHDGQTYEIWQICFTSEFQIKENRIYSPEAGEMRRVVREDGLDVALFSHVIKRLTDQEKKLIDFSLEPGANDHKRWLCVRNKLAYRAAFDRLSEIMEKLRNEHQKPMEKK